ncbi:MAG: hypothetical protein AAGA20_21215, partial [Planctomycetota bacterium]
AGAAVVACVLAAAQATRLRARPDTLTEAATWIDANVARDAPIHLTNLRSLPLFMRPGDVTPEMVWANGPWEIYQWALGHPKFRRVRGERTHPNRPTIEGPTRLGRDLVYATPADQYRMLLAENRIEKARAILAEADTPFSVVATSPAATAGPVPTLEIAAGWHGLLVRDGWELVHIVENGLPSGEPAIEYRLHFVNVFRARALGPDVEIYAAPGG